MKGKNLWFDTDSIFVEFDNGQIIGNPLTRFPRLKNASPKERAHYRFNAWGIRWDSIDEDISFKGLFSYKNDFFNEVERVSVAKRKPRQSPKVFA